MLRHSELLESPGAGGGHMLLLALVSFLTIAMGVILRSCELRSGAELAVHMVLQRVNDQGSLDQTGAVSEDSVASVPSCSVGCKVYKP